MDKPPIIDAEFKVVRARPRIGLIWKMWLVGTGIWVALVRWATDAPSGWYENTVARPPTFWQYMGLPLAVLAVLALLSGLLRRD